MKTKEEIKQWLLENCVNEFGDLDLTNLDFSDFNGKVLIHHMKVQNGLDQSFQQVNGKIYQNCQTTSGSVFQGRTVAKLGKKFRFKA